MARFVSLLMLVAILVIISIIFFQVMASFFVPLFLAALLGVVVQPLFRWTLVKCGGYRYWAAGTTTALVALIVLLPIGLVVTTATLEGLSLLDRLQLGDVRVKLSELRHNLGLEIPRERDVRRIEAVLHTWRERQRTGQPLDFDAQQVKTLIARVENIEKWLEDEKQAGTLTSAADPARLKSALQQLLSADEISSPPIEVAPPEDALPEPIKAAEDKALQKEDALLLADAEFREFKRNLLGGTYRA